MGLRSYLQGIVLIGDGCGRAPPTVGGANPGQAGLGYRRMGTEPESEREQASEPPSGSCHVFLPDFPQRQTVVEYGAKQTFLPTFLWLWYLSEQQKSKPGC